MKVKMLNLYSNETEPKKGLRGRHGQSFLLSGGGVQFLYDVGGDSGVLLSNMAALGISPNEIDGIILSHGHYDHTRGLPGFLDAYSGAHKLPIWAHPSVREKKLLLLPGKKLSIGCPDLSEGQLEKVDFQYSRKPMKITPYLETSGEVLDRPEADGVEKGVRHLVDGDWVPDLIADDLTLSLNTAEGRVIIAGCAHSGIINICRYFQRVNPQPIRAIVGGTHMVRYSKKAVLRVAEILNEEFKAPELFLNHCTDRLPIPLIPKTPTLALLRKYFGMDLVHPCRVGTSLIYEVPKNTGAIHEGLEKETGMQVFN